MQLDSVSIRRCLRLHRCVRSYPFRAFYLSRRAHLFPTSAISLIFPRNRRPAVAHLPMLLCALQERSRMLSIHPVPDRRCNSHIRQRIVISHQVLVVSSSSIGSQLTNDDKEPVELAHPATSSSHIRVCIRPIVSTISPPNFHWWHLDDAGPFIDIKS